LADPIKYPNLFPGFAEALSAEQERDTAIDNGGGMAMDGHQNGISQRQVSGQFKMN
jgi:hypothetical protein